MQRDNTTLSSKAQIRIAAMGWIKNPRVVETHGGQGALFRRCYYGAVSSGVVFETNKNRACALARSRPTWVVYSCDCEKALYGGAGFHHCPNFFDVDPYGSAHSVISAILSQASKAAEEFVVVVHDGLRTYVKINHNAVRDTEDAILRFGPKMFYEDYLPVCKWIMEQKVARAGCVISKWIGFYSGHAKCQTHFAALVKQRR